MKTLLVLLLLRGAYAGTDLNKFVGEWIHVGMYSAAPELRTCDHFNITLDGKPCSCDVDPASAVKFGIVALLIVLVESYQQVAAALSQRCTIRGITKTMALRLINDNYFVAYEKCYENTEQEPEVENMMARKVPSKAELDSLKGIEELKGRSGMTCGMVQ